MKNDDHHGHENPPVDCYSAGDRGFMAWSQRVRAALFGPLVRWLLRRGVTANQLTLAALLVGLAACPLLVLEPAAGLALLGVHVLLDGLDGPVARASGAAGSRGSLTDTLADQTVIAATTATLIYQGLVGAFAGTAYLFTYTLVVVFAMVRNALRVPYSWLVRPRFFVYAWILVEQVFAPRVFDVVLWVMSAVLGLKTITGYLATRRAM